MVIKFDDSDIGLVVIDGIFEDKITFGYCVMHWHGKGDDWETAIKEAKKGLNLSKVNQGSKPHQ
jgi:hypothetical protein